MGKTNHLRPICRKCEYRRIMGENGNGGYAVDTARLHGCLYFLIEGELRKCTPTDYECDKFKARSPRTKSLTGRHEIIK